MFVYIGTSEKIQSLIVDRISNKPEIYSSFSSNTEEKTMTSGEVLTDILSSKHSSTTMINNFDITSYIETASFGNQVSYSKIKNIADSYDKYRIEYSYGADRTVTLINYIPVS